MPSGDGETPIAPGKPCPTCGKPAVEKFRPFCSSRCRDVDLNRWLTGTYAIPAVEDDDEGGNSSGSDGPG